MKVVDIRISHYKNNSLIMQFVFVTADKFKQLTMWWWYDVNTNGRS